MLCICALRYQRLSLTQPLICVRWRPFLSLTRLQATARICPYRLVINSRMSDVCSNGVWIPTHLRRGHTCTHMHTPLRPSVRPSCFRFGRPSWVFIHTCGYVRIYVQLRAVHAPYIHPTHQVHIDASCGVCISFQAPQRDKEKARLDILLPCSLCIAYAHYVHTRPSVRPSVLFTGPSKSRHVHSVRRSACDHLC